MSFESVEQVSHYLEEFAQQRDWNQFQSPKNLAMALSVEASELVEIFQWLTEEESKSLPAEKLKHAGEELADIFFYTLRLCQKLDVDLMAAAAAKANKNEAKYPADLVRGSAKKYSDY